MLTVEQIALAEYEAFVASAPVVLVHHFARWELHSTLLRRRVELALEPFDPASVRTGMFDCDQPLPAPLPAEIDRVVVPKIAIYRDGRATIVLAGLQPAEVILDAVARTMNAGTATA